MSCSQVAAAPKAASKKAKDKAEKVEPKTMAEFVDEQLPEVLKMATTARGLSIKLTGVAYAGDLSSKMLDHAVQLEKCFKDLRDAKDSGDENKMKSMMDIIQKKAEFGEKAKAGRLTQVFFPHNWKCSELIQPYNFDSFGVCDANQPWE